jgi:hypothetical protein
MSASRHHELFLKFHSQVGFNKNKIRLNEKVIFYFDKKKNKLRGTPSTANPDQLLQRS